MARRRMSKAERAYRQALGPTLPLRGRAVRDFAYKEKLRQRVFALVGQACVWCGERDNEVLVLDHLHSDGGETRRRIASGSHTYLEIVQGRLPKEAFQVLCHNCNHRKRLLEVRHGLVNKPYASTRLGLTTPRAVCYA